MGAGETTEARLARLEGELAQKRRDLENLSRVHSQTTKRLRILERLHPLFADPRAIEANLGTVLDTLMPALDCDAGSVLLIDAETREFFFAAARGPRSEELVGLRFPVEKGLAGACALSKQALAVSDVARDPRFYKEISRSVGFDVSSILALPMHDGPGVLGVIELLNKRGTAEFRADEIETATRVADLAARLVGVGLEMDQPGTGG